MLEKPAVFVLQLNDLLLFKVHQSETYFCMDSLSDTLQYQICCHLVQSSHGEGQLLEDAKCVSFRTTQHWSIIEMKVCQNSQCKVVKHMLRLVYWPHGIPGPGNNSKWHFGSNIILLG